MNSSRYYCVKCRQIVDVPDDVDDEDYTCPHCKNTVENMGFWRMDYCYECGEECIVDNVAVLVEDDGDFLCDVCYDHYQSILLGELRRTK